MEENYKLVDFAKYCPECIHSDLPEVEDIYDDEGRLIDRKATICSECLGIEAREYSHRPEKFVKKEEEIQN